MKSLKCFSLLLAFLFVGVASTFAQDATPAQAMDAKKEVMKDKMADLIAALNLSEDQKVKFEAITAKYGDKLKALKANSADAMANKEEVKALHEEKNAELKEVLTEEQFKMYLEKQKAMKPAKPGM